MKDAILDGSFNKTNHLFQDLAFREVPSPDLSQVSPPSSFASAGTEPAPAFVQEDNNESLYNNNNNDQSFFPENAKSQEASQEYQDDTEPASFSYANFEQKLGQVQNNFGQNVTTYQEPGSNFWQQNKEPVSVKKPLGLSAEMGGSMKKDFDESFNPGFTDFGNFGGQSYANILWGNKKGEK